MSLSERIVNNISKQVGTEWILSKDVREAVKELKKRIEWMITIDDLNQIFGDELVKDGGE